MAFKPVPKICSNNKISDAFHKISHNSFVIVHTLLKAFFILSPIRLISNPRLHYNNLKANNKVNTLVKMDKFYYKSWFLGNKA